MTAVVPDTSVWIRLIRHGDAEQFIRKGLRTRTILLSSVVAHELYLGATDPRDKRDLDRIRTAFETEGLTISPTFENWCIAAVMINRYRRLHGAIDPRVHLHDVLVLLCAVQLRATLVTWNLADMIRWNQMLPRALQVRVTIPV